MTDSDFAEQFLGAVGAELNLIDRALAGKLHDFIRYETLVDLITSTAGTAAKRKAIANEIHHACCVGQLRARLLPGRPGVPVIDGHPGGDISTGIVGNKEDDYIIHRDDARRYFQKLDQMPDPGTPLWCWLRGKPADEAKTLRPDQQDKADFQKLAMEHWEISPTTVITGPNGCAALVGQAYLRHYATETVEGWAREVAPEGVKGKRGRPKKISAEAGK